MRTARQRITESMKGLYEQALNSASEPRMISGRGSNADTSLATANTLAGRTAKLGHSGQNISPMQKASVGNAARKTKIKEMCVC